MTAANIPGWAQRAQVIDIVHHRIHQGVFFQAGFDAEDVAAAGDIEMLIRTNGSVPHLRFEAVAGGNARFELFEGATVSADGAALTRNNHNRLSSNTAVATMFSGPTVTAPGTKINGDGLIAGGFKGGAASSSFVEWVLAPQTLYLARLTNIGNQAADLGIAAFWYEVTKNEL